jgi:hypothetical protein
MNTINAFFAKIATFWNSPEVLHAVINNRFFMIFLVIVLLKLKYKTYNSIWLCALINMPGTVLHETMHFVVGFFLNANPTSYNIFPRRSEGGSYAMGSVGFRNITFYNAMPSSMAPFLLLPIGYYLNHWYFQNISVTLFNYMGYILLQTILIENAVPSSTDFKVCFSHPLGLVLYGAICLLCLGLL